MLVPIVSCWTRLLVVAVAVAVATTADTDCDALPPCRGAYEPVCASDDTTYFNACQFERVQCKQPSLELIATGVCCPIACPLVVTKVCGSDGETYTSACELLRARCDGAKSTLRLVSAELCGGRDCAARYCDTAPKTPLCGSDYRTYANRCELERAQCLSGDPEEPSFSYDGPCIGGPQGIPEALVVGDDMPLFMPADMEAGDTPQEPMNPDPSPLVSSTSVCAGTSFQICGSDGITYDDVCAFVSARRANDAVQFARLGSCSDDEPSPVDGDADADVVDQCDFACPAPLVYEPVCTATGVVFPNKCAYVSALCRELTLPSARPELCDPLVLPSPVVSDLHAY